jgi:hypothetical protein
VPKRFLAYYLATILSYEVTLYLVALPRIGAGPFS